MSSSVLDRQAAAAAARKAPSFARTLGREAAPVGSPQPRESTHLAYDCTLGEAQRAREEREKRSNQSSTFTSATSRQVFHTKRGQGRVADLGPGTYDVKRTSLVKQPHRPSPAFASRADRFGKSRKKRANVNSPQQTYMPPSFTEKQGGHRFAFAETVDAPSATAALGPGSYVVEDLHGDITKVSHADLTRH